MIIYVDGMNSLNSLDLGDIDMNIDVTIWKIIDGEIVELKHDNHVFMIKENTSTKIITKPIPIPKKPVKLNVKKTYLEKWIHAHNINVFTPEQFYKEYPKQRENKYLDRNIMRLISEKKIMQLGKNKFKVIR